MLYYDKIDVSEGLDINETSASKECDICCYWYFLDKGFMFQPDVCTCCHDVLMRPINLSNIVILNIGTADNCCIINRISNREAVNWLQKVD